jgi:hypothetical protein
LEICKTPAEEVITFIDAHPMIQKPATKRTFGLSERVTLKCATGQNEATVTKLSLKAAQNEQKRPLFVSEPSMVPLLPKSPIAY